MSTYRSGSPLPTLSSTVNFAIRRARQYKSIDLLLVHPRVRYRDTASERYRVRRSYLEVLPGGSSSGGSPQPQPKWHRKSAITSHSHEITTFGGRIDGTARLSSIIPGATQNLREVEGYLCQRTGRSPLPTLSFTVNAATPLGTSI